MADMGDKHARTPDIGYGTDIVSISRVGICSKAHITAISFAICAG